MTRSIEWAERARKDLLRLDRTARERVLTALDRYAAEGYGDVKRLKAVEPPVYRLRVGEWRVVFALREVVVVLVLRVRPRGDAYR
ncbi:MAG: type II toxin-antitoxin system RelE/ParE family toxin [Actinobacteria bacterium]|nr:type II toxin-antitoxin system RelE/ParE family toxin [Actinomycetota bacterium]